MSASIDHQSANEDASNLAEMMSQTPTTAGPAPLSQAGTTPINDFSDAGVSRTRSGSNQGRKPPQVVPRGVPVDSLYHRLFVRVLNRIGQVSPRTAIKAQCLDCMGLDREGVAECRDQCCPLWHFRPYRKEY
jgi:hypothetical protein